MVLVFMKSKSINRGDGNEWEKIEMSCILFRRDKTRQHLQTLLGIPTIIYKIDIFYIPIF